jgi:hypothetical protein
MGAFKLKHYSRVASLMVRTLVMLESSRLRPGAGFGSFLAGFFDSRFAVFLFPISTVYPPRADFGDLNIHQF